MLRSWTSITTPLLLVFFAAFCFGQATPSQSSSPTSTSAPATSSAQATVDDDEDSPDIPPIARGRVSEEEYLRLRDRHIGMLRGVDDLARNPRARSQAIRKMEGQEQNLRRNHAAAVGAASQAAINLLGPTWTALGPDPIPNGQTVNTSAAVSGRVTSIALDPTNENIVYVGTALGGLYRSLDGGLTWLPLMDSAQSLAIGALTLDPTDPSILFVGTGEGNFSGDSFFGVGVYVITNANSSMLTPSVNGPLHTEAVTGNDIFTGRSITRILVNPANDSQILVSTASGVGGESGDLFSTLPSRGVYASNNVFSSPGVVGSPTFTKLSIFTGNGGNRSVTDMVLDPGAPGTVLVTVFGSNSPGEGGIWVTNNAWAATPTWNQTSRKPSRTTNGFTAVAKFAVSRSTVGTPTTTFFASFDESVSCTPPGRPAVNVTGTLYSSTDGTFPGPGLPAADGFCGGQCWYDMAVAANPTDPTKVYIGGNGASGSVGACGTGPMGISTNGGASFTTSETSLHADSHVTVVSLHNPSVVYTGNDGGIFRSTDGGMTWASLNNAGFNATQFESIAVHPTDPTFTIGGTQDNGTPFLQPGGAWTRADFGDGGFSAIDQNARDTTNVTMYHTYFNLTGSQIGFARVTSVTSAHDDGWMLLGCFGANANGITCGDTVLFYAPLALGPGTPNNTVYLGTDRLYRSSDQGTTNMVVSQAPIVANVPISAIGISPQDDNVRLVGLGNDATSGAANGHVFVTMSGSSTLTDVTGPWAAEYIGRALIDPNTKTTAYITLDGYGTPSHVWKTINLSETAGVTTWTAASSGLPDVPVNALVVDPTNSNLLYVGTDIGVYNSTDGGATWNPYGTGLPRVAVFDLKITAGHMVRIATHGRGMWEIPAATALPTTTGLSVSSNNTTFGTPVTLTATVSTGGNATIPTGTVNFLDGSTSLGTATLNVSGQAAFTTSTLSVASHSITDKYSGDSVYAPSTSSPQVINVSNAPNADYSLNIPNGSATVQPGTAASYTINLTVTNGFTGSVNFSCTSGVPSLANCSFNPTTVPLSGSPASTTLTISTTAPTAAPPANNLGARLATGSGFFALALVLGLTSRKRRRQRTLLMTLGILAFTAGLISCGGGGSTVKHNPGTPPGTYTITISATSGNTTHTSTITLTVQ